MIGLSGYAEEEKLEIAKRYLVRRRLEANVLKPEQATVDNDILFIEATRSPASGRLFLTGQLGDVMKECTQ